MPSRLALVQSSCSASARAPGNMPQRRWPIAAPPPASARENNRCAVDGWPAAGAAAMGHRRWGLLPGARADALQLDCASANLLGIPGDRRLDAMVFSSPAAPWQDVMVAGQWVLRGGRHARGEAIQRDFVLAMAALWSGDSPDRRDTV